MEIIIIRLSDWSVVVFVSICGSAAVFMLICDSVAAFVPTYSLVVTFVPIVIGSNFNAYLWFIVTFVSTCNIMDLYWSCAYNDKGFTGIDNEICDTLLLLWFWGEVVSNHTLKGILWMFGW